MAAFDKAPTQDGVGAPWPASWVRWFNQLYTALSGALAAISGLQASRTTDEANISSLQTTVSGHTSSISSLQSSRTTDEANISSLQGTVATHTTELAGIPIANGALSGSLNLNGQTLSGTAGFTGALTLSGGLTLNSTLTTGAGQPIYWTTSDASWQEFRLFDFTGGSAAADFLTFQYNTRSSPGGTDTWANALTIASQSGTVTVAASLVISTAANITFGAGWVAWTPTLTLAGSTTASGVSASGFYLRKGPEITFSCSVVVTFGTAAPGIWYVSLPFSVSGVSFWPCSAFYQPNNSICAAAIQGNLIAVLPLPGQTFATGTAYTFYFSGTYRVA